MQQGSNAGSSRGRTDKGVTTTESQRDARTLRRAHWGQFGQRRSTLNKNARRVERRVERREVWVWGVRVGMGVGRRAKMLRAIPTITGKAWAAPRRSDLMLPRDAPPDAKPKPQFTRCIECLRSHLQMPCAALHDKELADCWQRQASRYGVHELQFSITRSAPTVDWCNTHSRLSLRSRKTTTVPLLSSCPLCSSESRSRTSNSDRAYRLLRAGPSREQLSDSTMMIKLQLSHTAV
jgi:hypothetical protein